jgi:hypothetical protein
MLVRLDSDHLSLYSVALESSSQKYHLVEKLKDGMRA